MEHLFCPSELDRRRSSLPETPWLGFDHDSSQQYALASFEEYPRLRGWSEARLQELRHGFFSGDTNFTEILAMLQSWLFFGLLEGAFQQHFPSSSFLATSERPQTKHVADHQRVLSTSYLREFYKQWNLNFLDLPMAQQQSLSASFGQSVLGAREWALYLEAKLRVRASSFNDPPLFIVFNATVRNTLLLTELLSKAVPKAFPQGSFTNHQMDLDPGGEIRGWLRRREWCPSSPRMLMQRYGHSVAMYATILPPVEQPYVTHKDCSSSQCTAYNVDVSTYLPRHVRPGCKCEHLLPSLQQVFDILQSGSFPILDASSMLSDADQGQLSLKRHEGKMQYVAISHVWSDGLGSTTEQGLPRCQVLYIAHLCSTISGSPLFWIDGLCIPKKPAMRHKAVQLMTETYANASTTLVLDCGLRQCSSSAAIEEIALRILSSAWLRRLWTFKEATLASNLVFLLHDAFLPMSHLLSQIFEAGFSGPISGALLSELSGFNRNLYAKKPAHINHIQRLICYRTSSRLEDETIAIAPLFHLDVDVLFQSTGEARMVAFLMALQTVPGGLIFSAAPRLSTPGFRWAPRTLMHAQGLNDLGTNNGQVTERGFVGDFLVLEFEDPLIAAKGEFFRLLDIARKKGFAFWITSVDPQSSDEDEQSSLKPITCDMIAIREQSTGEIIPGVAVVLTKQRSTADTKNNESEALTCAFAGRAIVDVDELAELDSWRVPPTSGAIIVRGEVKTLRIV